MIVTDILLDGLFAAVAAIGFGAISDPPMRAFPRIALLAAIGHALRFTLIHCAALVSPPHRFSRPLQSAWAACGSAAASAAR